MIQIRSANPSLSVAQAMGEVAKRWKTLSDSQKKVMHIIAF